MTQLEKSVYLQLKSASWQLEVDLTVRKDSMKYKTILYKTRMSPRIRTKFLWILFRRHLLGEEGWQCYFCCLGGIKRPTMLHRQAAIAACFL